LDSSVDFTIKGIIINIGDNISLLGNYTILTYREDRRKEIVYKIGSQVIEIGYDINTSLITKIKYVYYN
jgi:hypothetical protein